MLCFFLPLSLFLYFSLLSHPLSRAHTHTLSLALFLSFRLYQQLSCPVLLLIPVCLHSFFSCSSLSFSLSQWQWLQAHPLNPSLAPSLLSLLPLLLSVPDFKMRPHPKKGSPLIAARVPPICFLYSSVSSPAFIIHAAWNIWSLLFTLPVLDYCFQIATAMSQKWFLAQPAASHCQEQCEKDDDDDDDATHTHT